MPSPNHRSGGSLSLASTGAAVRRGDLKISDPIPYDESGEMFNGPNTVPPTRYHSAHPSNDATWPRKSTPIQDFHMRHVSDVPANTSTRLSAGPSLIPSSMSSIPSKSSLNQKKPGGLRAVLKRMFSGKRHRSVPSGTNGYHYSDPSYLNPVIEQPTRPRLDSAPALGTETIARTTALTSHATYQQPESTDQSVSIPPRRGRRNTLPSLVFSDKDSSLVPAINNWAVDEPSQPKLWVKEDFVSDGQLKRRSRSADQLNELLRRGGVEPSPTRDRAGEIAYWRNSAIAKPVPVYSGQSIAVDPVHVLGTASAVEDSEHESSSIVHPMQTFDFGLDGTLRDDSSLEQRVNTVEIKLIDLEYAIAKLQGTDIPKPMSGSAPFTRGSIHNIFLQDKKTPTPTSLSSNDVSYLSSPATGHDLTFLSSPGASPFPSPEVDGMFRSQRASKATTATIRPLTARKRSPRCSRGTSPSSIHISPDRFETLIEMVREEQDARQKLEVQIMEMQKELDCLRTPVYATIKEAYPTPSPNSTHQTPDTPRSKTLHRTQPFHLGGPQEISRFSGTEVSDEEEGFEDVYETPLEKRNTFETARDSPPVAAT